MKNLEELKKHVFAIPSFFGDGTAHIPGKSTSGDVNDQVSFRYGFSIRTSKNPISDNGSYILRAAMNGIGAMASQEKLVRDSGGVHTESNAILSSGGYPNGALLVYDDGKYLKLVESQRADNVYHISSTLDRFTPTGETTYIQPPWKSVNQVYGIDESLFHIEVDYSLLSYADLKTTVTVSASTMAFLGAAYYGNGTSRTAISNINVPVVIDSDGIATLQNKGTTGYVRGTVRRPNIFDWTSFGSLNVPVPEHLYGGGNFCETYMLRAGQSIRCDFYTQAWYKQTGLIGLNFKVHAGQ